MIETDDQEQNCGPKVALNGYRPSGEWGAGYGGHKEKRRKGEGEHLVN